MGNKLLRQLVSSISALIPRVPCHRGWAESSPARFTPRLWQTLITEVVSSRQSRVSEQRSAKIHKSCKFKIYPISSSLHLWSPRGVAVDVVVAVAILVVFLFNCFLPQLFPNYLPLSLKYTFISPTNHMNIPALLWTSASPFNVSWITNCRCYHRLSFDAGDRWKDSNEFGFFKAGQCRSCEQEPLRMLRNPICWLRSPKIHATPIQVQVL